MRIVFFSGYFQKRFTSIAKQLKPASIAKDPLGKPVYINNRLNDSSPLQFGATRKVFDTSFFAEKNLEINAEKINKSMTNNEKRLSTQIKASGQELKWFRYFDSMISKKGSRIKKIISRAAEIRGKCRNAKKTHLRRKSTWNWWLAFSIFLQIFRCRTAAKIQVLEIRFYRTMLGLSYVDRITYDTVRECIKHSPVGRPQIHCQSEDAEMVWTRHQHQQSFHYHPTRYHLTQKKNRHKKKNYAGDVTGWTGISFTETTPLTRNRDIWGKLVNFSAAKRAYHHTRAWEWWCWRW